MIGVGDDGLVYILKRVQDGALVPVSEYVCTRMAAAIGLAVPTCEIAELPGEEHELCFASREEYGAMTQRDAAALLLNAQQLRPFADKLMQWYAFDLFAANVDRHVGNFLIRHSMVGAVMLGMDFSHALLTQGWPRTLPPMGPCNTTAVQRTLSRVVPYPAEDAARVMNRLAEAPADWLDECLRTVPAGWINDKLRADVCRWWRHGRQRRLRLLRSHLTNGRYLQLFPHSRRA